MDRKELVENIIYIITNENIRVELSDSGKSSIHVDQEMENGRIKSVKPCYIEVSENTLFSTKVFPYLQPQQKYVWQNYSQMLFVILHELGHYFTLPGLSMIEHKSELYQVCLITNEKERDCFYRSVRSESLADEWATNWVMNHFELASQFSKKLSESFNK